MSWLGVSNRSLSPVIQTSVNGYDGSLAISSLGKLVNGHGSPINLRGENMFGLESQPTTGLYTTSEWGNNGPSYCAPSGPVWTLLPSWGINSVRVPLSAQIFCGLNFGVLDLANGSSATPAWLGTTATANSSGTTITCAALAANFTVGPNPTYLLNLTNPGGVPANTQILTASGTTITTNAACTIANGDVLSYVKKTDGVGKILQAVTTAILYARQVGCYVLIDNHWSAPRFTFKVGASATNMTAYLGSFGQPIFNNADDSALFWTGSCITPYSGSATSFPQWLSINFGSAAGNSAKGLNGGAAGTYWDPRYGGADGISDVIFELFNEPYLNFFAASSFTKLGGGTPANVEFIMRNGGTRGTFENQLSGIGPNGCGITNSAPYSGVINATWTLCGYQQLTSALRSQLFSNVIMCNADGFGNYLEGASNFIATDTQSPSQIAVGWHCYQNTRGTNVPAGGASEIPTYLPALVSGTALGFAVPVINSEYGPAQAGGPTAGPAAPNPDAYISYIQGVTDNINATYGNGSLGNHPFQWTNPLLATNASAVSCTISGGVLTVTGTVTGTISNGMAVFGAGLPAFGSAAPVAIATQGGDTGAGGAGTYHLSGAAGITISSGETMTFQGTSSVWECCEFAGNPVTVTATIVGTTMTVTNTVSGLAPNMVLASGFPGNQGTWIVAQLSGTLGAGSGATYQLSDNMGGGSGLQFDAIVPANGQGSTNFNWTSGHASP
jgi:hypothetical protein